eukprot:TRINITY_DN12417_c0_g1_i1.p1 TRINITY_DN12417_c0_g1~~TRINITY_DN12417_c0_g1_i1.p1  ORF type:complete len:146 (-),score=34.26 TRINITY_DN12417_c0_g1_i1:91-528(-)
MSQMMQMLGAGNGSGKAQQMMQLLSTMQGGQEQGDTTKDTLNSWLQKTTGNSPTKAEVVYNTMEVPGSKPPSYISSVVLLTLDPSRTFSGEPSPSKKLAEISAAAAALRENGQEPPTPRTASSGSGGNKKKKKKKGAVPQAMAGM